MLLKLNRQHWQIENTLHRTKDVTFKEDASTIHKDNAPHSMAALRNAAVTFIKNFSEPAIKKIELFQRYPKRLIRLLTDN